MKELSERFHESCSAAILQGTDVVYVARVPAGRIMSVAISIGTRLPAFHTSIGRVQLGFLDDDELWRRLRSLRIEAYTTSTITDVQALFERIRADREQGFSIVDEELERGLRSIAVPIVDRAGQAVAGAQPLHPLDAHHPQRDARALPAGAARGGGADRGDHRVTPSPSYGRGLHEGQLRVAGQRRARRFRPPVRPHGHGFAPRQALQVHSQRSQGEAHASFQAGHE